MKLSRNLRYHWRSHVTIALGVIVTTAVVVGSLMVGSIVKGALKDLAEQRLGKVSHAVIADGRFFDESLAPKLATELSTDVAPILRLAGVVSASNAEGVRRSAPDVAVYGINEQFATMAQVPFDKALLEKGEDGRVPCLLNPAMAKQLQVAVGDIVNLRMPKPTWLPTDSIMADDESKKPLPMRLKVAGILDAASLGNFNLAANQQVAFNIFIPLIDLQKKADYGQQANGYLLRADARVDTAAIDAAIAKLWQPKDVGLYLHETDSIAELRSKRLFMADEIAEETEGLGSRVFTYLVHKVQRGEQITPYSMVAAVDPSLFALQGGPEIPSEWPEDGIVLNDWLAKDLGDAKVGETVSLHYKALDEVNNLIWESKDFKVLAIIPMTGAAADRSLMPPFPGIEGAESCTDWEGAGIDFDEIPTRDQDEEYWKAHKGTPKAFIHINAGRKAWTNIYGSLTGLRVAKDKGPELLQALRQRLPPEGFGLAAMDIAQAQQQALNKSMDIGQLFLSLSFFLVAAGLMVTGLLFAFALTKRRKEIGLLRAIGYPAKRVNKLLLLEHGLVAAIGVVLGCILAVLYTMVLLQALNGVWADVIGGVALQFTVDPVAFISGGLAVLIMAAGVFWMRLRGLKALVVLDLLRGSLAISGVSMSSRRVAWIMAALSAVAAIGIVATAGPIPAAVMQWFGAGACVLIALLCLLHAAMGGWVHRAAGGSRHVFWLAMANLTRHWGRSLTVLVLLAMAGFMVLSIGAHFKHTRFDPDDKTSGTGGFELFATSSLALAEDIRTVDGRAFYNMTDRDADWASIGIVPFRRMLGDEASCRNLNRAQRPTIWGVPEGALKDRFTFQGLAGEVDPENPWAVLDQVNEDGTIPCLGDVNTLMWAMGFKMPGSHIESETDAETGESYTALDEHGDPFTLQVMGHIKDSIWQGGVLISEKNLKRLFPSKSGYQTFLFDLDPSKQEEVAEMLGRKLQQNGFVVSTGGERLTEFNRIQNLYMVIFQILGALGLLLGSFGLVVILLRNVEERRNEFATLRAIGYRRNRLTALLLFEHIPLLLLGLGAGLVSAVVGVVPALVVGDSGAASSTVVLLLVGVIAIGVITITLAAKQALRQPLLGDLRRE